MAIGVDELAKVVEALFGERSDSFDVVPSNVRKETLQRTLGSDIRPLLGIIKVPCRPSVMRA